MNCSECNAQADKQCKLQVFFKCRTKHDTKNWPQFINVKMKHCETLHCTTLNITSIVVVVPHEVAGALVQKL